MPDIKAKIFHIAELGDKSGAKVHVEFNDAGYVWQKTYILKNTEVVKLADFKDILKEDLKKDLKPGLSPTQSLNKEINKEFIISI